MATLHFLIGLPGSGKSTFAKKIAKDNFAVILSSDNIRKELFGYENQDNNGKVFEVMNNRAIELLKNNIDVVYDATNLNEKKRRTIISRAKNVESKIVAYLCCTQIDKILERNLTRTERKIPWEKLELMISSINPPMYYEGFDDIYVINNGVYDNKDGYIDNLMKKCENYNQDNPYHLEPLDMHIKSVIKKVQELAKERNIEGDALYLLIVAAQFHDLGKIYTRKYKEDKQCSVYYGHENVSCYLFLCFVSLFFKEQKLTEELSNSAILILNHMEWYKRDDMSVIKNKIGNYLFSLLEILHEADDWGRNKNAMIGENE